MSSEAASHEDDGGNATTMIALVASLTSISAIFVAARLFVRTKMHSLGLDDYLIVLAMVTPKNMYLPMNE